MMMLYSVCCVGFYTMRGSWSSFSVDAARFLTSYFCVPAFTCDCRSWLIFCRRLFSNRVLSSSEEIFSFVFC
jgi:hypothetical protein